MCEPQLVSKYQALTHGKTILESSLHRNMLEHMNSEIALGTITNIQTAKDWLRGSFLYQRLQKNPDHYAIQHDASTSWQEKLNEIVLQNIDRLESTKLVKHSPADEGSTLESTEYGDIMSKVRPQNLKHKSLFINPVTQFYIRQNTVRERSAHVFSCTHKWTRWPAS
jgi:ATP-dependent DNA helicase HFM1/MER3